MPGSLNDKLFNCVSDDGLTVPPSKLATMDLVPLTALMQSLSNLVLYEQQEKNALLKQVLVELKFQNYLLRQAFNLSDEHDAFVNDGTINPGVY